jgi:hypothetical protein
MDAFRGTGPGRFWGESANDRQPEFPRNHWSRPCETGLALALFRFKAGEPPHFWRDAVAAAVAARLADAGRVERYRSDADRRRTAVRITREGRALPGDAPRPPTHLPIPKLAAMDDDELHAPGSRLVRPARERGLANAPAPVLFAEDAGRRPRARKRIGNG